MVSEIKGSWPICLVSVATVSNTGGGCVREMKVISQSKVEYVGNWRLDALVVGVQVLQADGVSKDVANCLVRRRNRVRRQEPYG